MIRAARFLYCDNEHGVGNISFPDLDSMTDQQRDEHFINPPTAAQLRKSAKKAGWSRCAGGDYCEMCTEGGI